MNFVNEEKIIIELYKKNERCSDEYYLNNDSHWFFCDKNIIDDNEDILDKDYTYFMEKINKIYEENIEIIKSQLIECYGDTCLEEFDKIKNEVDITLINNFFEKYLLDNKYKKCISNTYSIKSINRLNENLNINTDEYEMMICDI